MSDRTITGHEALIAAIQGDPVARLQVEISDHIAEIADLFKPGVKLTLVARSPEHPDGSRDVIVTNDTIADVIAALQLRVGR